MKFIRKLFVGSLLAASVGVVSTPANALPTGFTKTTAWQGLTLPTAVKFAPNGHVFVLQKNGKVLFFNSVNDAVVKTAADLSAQTYTDTDHGLLGLAIHPNYPTTPYIYVLYSRKLGSNGAQLSRLTINNGVMTAETSFTTGWCQQSTSHAIGDLNFGTDGMLYVTSGDGASPGFADIGQGANSQGANNCGDSAQTGGALRSQDILPGFNTDTTKPVELNGKLLRLDPITGAAAAGNPLLGGDTRDDRIVAYGLRNPFRFTINPVNNQFYIADVGWDAWEEIDRVVNVLDPAVKNFGWPCYEGNHISGAMQANNTAVCNSLYGAQNNLHTPPFYEYAHNGSPGGTQAAITAVSFYNGDSYPAQYKGALFFGDYTDGWTKVAFPDANGVPNMAGAIAFDNTASVVQLVAGPNGDIFYVDVNGGKIYRFSTNNVTGPKAAVSVDKSGGSPGTTINFDASTSTDPSGAAIAYDWDLNGDGQFGDSTVVKPVFSYPNVGTYAVSLKVTTPSTGLFSIANQVINISNLYPLPSITSPATSTLWKTNDTISYAGNAVIPGTGETIAANQLSWDVKVYHCALNDATVCHTHVAGAFTGDSGSFLAPDHEYPSRLDIKLTASGPVTAVAWWDNAWTKRRWLFFNNAANNQALTNFPVLVQLDATRIDYSAAGTNGASLRFVAADGTVLPHEIETWNTAGTSYVWVKVPSIAANSANSYVHMYYGNAAATNGQNATAVWSNGYAGVWHMNASSNDATAAANNGANVNATDTAGKFGGARLFNGTTAYINVPDSASLKLAGAYTMEAWVKIADANAARFDRIISKKAGFNDSTGYSLEYNPATNQVTGLAGGPAGALDWYRAEPVDLDATWHYVVATVNGAAANIYVDGVDRTSDGVSVATTVNNVALNIGRDAFGNNYFAGSIDEVRLSNTNRPAGWIVAQNRSMTNKFVYFTNEESPAPLTGSTMVTIQPQTSTVTVNTNPQGLTVVLNSETGPAPITHQVIINATTNITASSPQTKNGSLYSFLNWDDSSTTASRVFNANATNSAYTAAFSASVIPALKVYLKTAWAAPRIYYWGVVGSTMTTAWPGVALAATGVANVSSFTFNAGTTSSNIIFSNNGATQTANLARTSSDANNCWDAAAAAWTTPAACGIVTNVAPTANAGVDKTVLENGSVTLTGSGTDSDGTIASYQWKEGATVLGNAASLTVNNLTVGTHTYTLTVTDNAGATGADTAVVTVSNVAPIADAGSDQTVDEGSNVVLNGAGADIAGSVTFRWLNGATQLATTQGYTITATNAGSRTLTLEVNDGEGGITTDTVTVTANNVSPTASAGADLSKAEGSSVTLTGSGTDAAGTVTFKWKDNGGAVVCITVNCTITVPAAATGPYTYTLEVTDDEGTVTSDSMVLTSTANLVPVANAGADQTANENGSVTLIGSGTDSDGTIASYQWKEGATVLGNAASLTINNLTVGTHTYDLIVTDNAGATATDSVVVTVANVAPTVTASGGGTFTRTSASGKTVALIGSGSDALGSVTYQWKEGETVLSTLASPSLNFALGVHTLNLVVTDDEGVATISSNVVVTVNNAAPAANSGNDVTYTTGGSTTLSASASSDVDGTIASYQWSEGATVLSTATSFAYNATATGAHTITLTITDNNGAISTDTVIVTVNPATTTLKVYFKKSATGWAAPKLYYWTAVGGSSAANTWPGAAMSATGMPAGVFSYTFTTGTTSSNIIFNNGGSGGTNQTANLANTSAGANRCWVQTTANAGSWATPASCGVVE